MASGIRLDIENLEKDVLKLEDNIVEFSRLRYDEGIKKAIYQIRSNLKYLSILANGAPIDKNEDREIMDFLRIHYSYLKNYQYLFDKF